MGKPIIMGRKTYESIGRPLPGRQNIVLSSSPVYEASGCQVVNTVEEGLRLARGDEIMIIGGATLYQRFLPVANRLYITIIHREYEGDTFFPEIDLKVWDEVKPIEMRRNSRGDLAYSFHVFERDIPKGGSLLIIQSSERIE